MIQYCDFGQNLIEPNKHKRRSYTGSRSYFENILKKTHQDYLTTLHKSLSYVNEPFQPKREGVIFEGNLKKQDNLTPKKEYKTLRSFLK